MYEVENNKKFKIIFCLLFLINQLAAQNIGYNLRDSLDRKQGSWHFIMNNKGRKHLREVVNYKDDFKYGQFILYYDNGNIMRDGYYLNDTLNGESHVYRKDGTLYQIEPYKMGKLHGVKKNFDFLGKLINEQEYKEDILNGIDRTYSKSGRVISETINVDGLENGTRKIFSDDDSHEIIREFDFVNGEKTKSRFFKKGKLIKEESFPIKPFVSKPSID